LVRGGEPSRQLQRNVEGLHTVAVAEVVVVAQASLIPISSTLCLCACPGMLHADNKYEWEHAYIKKATAVQQASKWRCITCHSFVVAARCILPAAGLNVLQTFLSWPS
jgi:hypothetical protein